MPKETNVEIKVGAFVLVAIVLFFILIFSISDVKFFEQGSKMKVLFNFANGVKKAAPVRVAGVDAGLVQNISVFFDESDQKTKVAVEISVKKGTKIPIDSEFIINQLGLLGEKYIEIIPGVYRNRFYQEGDVIVGRDPIAQEAISNQVSAVAKKVEVTIDSINSIIGDQENKKSFKDTLSNLSLMTERLSVLAGSINEGKGTLGKLLYNDGLYDNLEEMTADLKANPWKLLYLPKSEKAKYK